MAETIEQGPGKESVGEDEGEQPGDLPFFEINDGRYAEVEKDQIDHHQNKARLPGDEKGGIEESGEQSDQRYRPGILVDGEHNRSDRHKEQQAHSGDIGDEVVVVERGEDGEVK